PNAGFWAQLAVAERELRRQRAARQVAAAFLQIRDLQSPPPNKDTKQNPKSGLGDSCRRCTSCEMPPTMALCGPKKKTGSEECASRDCKVEERASRHLAMEPQTNWAGAVVIWL